MIAKPRGVLLVEEHAKVSAGVFGVCWYVLMFVLVFTGHAG